MGFLKKLFQPTNKEPIIIVSGLPRSGTSMMMKMLEAGGIPPLTDEIREADTDNPKGYYEFERVKKLDKGDTAWLPEAEGKSVKVISALLKHLPDDYDYRIIFMRRDMDEILASQRKMLIRRGENADDVNETTMAQLFKKHLNQVENWLAQQSNVQTIFLHYSAILADPVPAIAKLNAFLGEKLEATAAAQVVDPDLYRNRSV